MFLPSWYIYYSFLTDDKNCIHICNFLLLHGSKTHSVKLLFVQNFCDLIMAIAKKNRRCEYSLRCPIFRWNRRRCRRYVYSCIANIPRAQRPLLSAAATTCLMIACSINRVRQPQRRLLLLKGTSLARVT